MKRLLSALGIVFLLSACVDTTGLSGGLTRPIKGNPNATVVVHEFADLQCPSCKAAHDTINPILFEKYATRVAFQFEHFPLRNIHRFSLDLAEASECAADQGKFWEFVDVAFKNQPTLKKGSIDQWAQGLALDMDLFGRCTASHIKRDAILVNYDQGVSAGVKGTPTYFVQNMQVPSTLEELTKAIEAALAKGGPKL